VIFDLKILIWVLKKDTGLPGPCCIAGRIRATGPDSGISTARSATVGPSAATEEYPDISTINKRHATKILLVRMAHSFIYIL
jgi:hypothetical protein